jgi:endonuclease/exonuclease/phosphatase family metal-dependent hydrolase
MKNIRSFFILLFVFVLILSCNQRSIDPDDPDNNADSNRLVKAVGTEVNFDIATWNIEQFPISGPTTISYVSQLIKDLDIDLFGLQEMNEATSFYRLLDSLPDYNGIVSDYPNDYLKLGIIYKKDIVSISNVTQIFTNDQYAFPRPPFMAYVEVKKENNTRFDFTLFVLHLKAMGGDANEARRKDACEKLHVYINNNILNSADKDVIVLGDWNDELEDPIEDNVFQIFKSDTANYTFLTNSLIGQHSYPSYPSLIDHIMITNDALSEFGNGNTKILDLDYQFSNYSTYVSDHRPVLAQFPVLTN